MDYTEEINSRATGTNMRTREGDLLENKDNVIFDVKGLVHPPDRVVAFPRYFPDKKGKRKRAATFYGKVYSFSERYAFLKERFPHYLVYDKIFDEMLCEVPIQDIEAIYKPTERLQELRASKELDAIENDALGLSTLLKEETKISWSAVGISGSVMVKLHDASSDIDPMVYGTDNCLKVYSVLKNLLKTKKSDIKPYTLKQLRKLFAFRSKDTIVNFESFVQTEARKVLQGKFCQRDYFIRFIKDWNETSEEYGDICYENAGYAKVKATIVDDSESIFTPCVYKIENAQVLEGSQNKVIREIVSFRGRFCEQAKTGESVIAQGKVEHVKDTKRNSEHFRLLLGNKPSDYMILA
jgi:predicted nucleotidyltransferase